MKPIKTAKTAITAGLLMGMSVALATSPVPTKMLTSESIQASYAFYQQSTNQEMAANVMTVKSPVIDLQLTNNHMTEVFMELINNGKQTHRLIAVTSPIAKKVQLHLTTVINGTPNMRQVTAITIPANAERGLQIGGLHVMLIGLKRHLIKNRHIPITLVFQDGSRINVRAKVENKIT